MNWLNELNKKFEGSWRITRTGEYYLFEVKLRRNNETFWVSFDKDEHFDVLLHRLFCSRFSFFDKHVVDTWKDEKDEK